MGHFSVSPQPFCGVGSVVSAWDEAAVAAQVSAAASAAAVAWDTRREAVQLAHAALTLYENSERAAIVSPQPRPALRPPQLDAVTRYLVKKLAYQEAGRGAASAEPPDSRNSRDMEDVRRFLEASERRMATRRVTLESAAGLQLGGRTVLSPGTAVEGSGPPLVPGAVVLSLSASGREVAHEDELRELLGELREGGKEAVIVEYTLPDLEPGKEVVLLQNLELRSLADPQTDEADSESGFEYERRYERHLLLHGAIGKQVDQASAGQQLVRVEFPQDGEHSRPLVFSVDRSFLAGIGKYRDYSNAPLAVLADDEREKDVALLLISAYGDAGTALTREEYEDLRRDTGLGDAFEAMRDPKADGVTARSLKRRAEGLITEHEDLLRQIALSRRAQKLSLQTSEAVCEAKQSGPPPTLRSIQADTSAVARRLAMVYSRKKGTALDELVENLKAPAHIDKMLVLAEASAKLLAVKGHLYPGKTQYDLLVMLLYTMSGPDIDTLMGYRDVPDYETQREEWNAYNAGPGKERNKALFSEVNGLMRAAADVENCDWSAVAKWAKTICHLHALCVDSEKFDASKSVLSRGITGLPESVVEAHRMLSSSSTFTWTAPSSCAVDPKIAVDYLTGNAANAQKKGEGVKNDSILFNVQGSVPALALSNVSKYPKEAEVLVPPLSVLRVKRTDAGEPVEGCFTIVAEWEEAAGLRDVTRRVQDDVRVCCTVLQRRSAEKDDAVRRLLGPKEGARPWLPTSRRPGFSGCNPAPPVADHHYAAANHAVCQNVLSPTSPKRTRSRPR